VLVLAGGTALGLIGVPTAAGAYGPAEEFCAVLEDGNQLELDLDEDTAGDGVESTKLLLKTDVPKKVRKALKKIKKGYERVADGEWNALDFLENLKKPLATYSEHAVGNCDLE